jgi:hypothetical protein
MVGPRHEVHGTDERVPGGSMCREDAAAGGGDPVHPPTSNAGLFQPSSGDPAAPLESIEQGIQRRGVEGQGALLTDVDQTRDVVPVQRAVFNEGQNEELGGALFQLGIVAWNTHMWDCNSMPRRRRSFLT